MIQHFVCDLGAYLYRIDDDWKTHCQLKEQTGKTVFRWCSTQELDTTSAVVRLIRQLSFAAARKVLAEDGCSLRVAHGVYSHQFSRSCIQLWDSSLKRPSCMFISTEATWRLSQLRMLVLSVVAHLALLAAGSGLGAGARTDCGRPRFSHSVFPDATRTRTPLRSHPLASVLSAAGVRRCHMG